MTASWRAAAATADATAGTTAASKTLGTICPGDGDGTHPAIARAAASFIDSVMRVAPESIAPRKMPGNASTLLIWLGTVSYTHLTLPTIYSV